MKKYLLNILVLIFLSGCVQSTAMVGPGITLVSSGNIPQAFSTFLTNRAIEEETGMTTHQFIAKKLEDHQVKNERKEIPEELIRLLEKNIKNTRSVINAN